MKSVRCIAFSIAALAAIMSAYGEESLLLHRWSFNGDLTDSVGEQTATAIRAVKRGLCLIVNRNP